MVSRFILHREQLLLTVRVPVVIIAALCSALSWAETKTQALVPTEVTRCRSTFHGLDAANLASIIWVRLDRKAEIPVFGASPEPRNHSVESELVMEGARRALARRSNENNGFNAKTFLSEFARFTDREAATAFVLDIQFEIRVLVGSLATTGLTPSNTYRLNELRSRFKPGNFDNFLIGLRDSPTFTLEELVSLTTEKLLAEDQRWISDILPPSLWSIRNFGRRKAERNSPLPPLPNWQIKMSATANELKENRISIYDLAEVSAYLGDPLVLPDEHTFYMSLIAPDLNQKQISHLLEPNCPEIADVDRVTLQDALRHLLESAQAEEETLKKRSRLAQIDEKILEIETESTELKASQTRQAQGRKRIDATSPEFIAIATELRERVSILPVPQHELGRLLVSPAFDIFIEVLHKNGLVLSTRAVIELATEFKRDLLEKMTHSYEYAKESYKDRGGSMFAVVQPGTSAVAFGIFQVIVEAVNINELIIDNSEGTPSHPLPETQILTAGLRELIKGEVVYLKIHLSPATGVHSNWAQLSNVASGVTILNAPNSSIQSLETKAFESLPNVRVNQLQSLYRERQQLLSTLNSM